MKSPAFIIFRLVLLTFFLALGTACSLNAAAFIKFDGIDGESLDSGYANHSDVLAWSWGVTRDLTEGDTGATRRRGEAKVEDIQITKELDKSSPKLFEGCLNGKVYPKVDVYLTRQAGGARVQYIVISMKNVLISSVSAGGSGGEDRLTENVSLNFEEITYTYTEFDDNTGTSKGNVEMTWKVEEGES